MAKHLDDTEAVLVELMTYNFKKWIIRSVPGNSISENGTVRRLHGISCQSQLDWCSIQGDSMTPMI